MKDLILTSFLIVPSALLVTVHLAIVGALLFRSPRWWALLALLVPPLAPYQASRQHMPFRAGLWVACAAVYLAARIAART